MANLFKAAEEGSIWNARKYVNAKEDINYKDEVVRYMRVQILATAIPLL